MSNRVNGSRVRLKAVLWAAAFAGSAAVLAPMQMSAQSAGGAKVRMNGIFERFAKGEPSFNGEAWQLMPDLEHNPFMMDDLEQGLAALKPEGAKFPVRAPVVRIPYESDQDYKHFVKQLLDIGVMGIIVPGVENAEQALKLVRSMRYPPQRMTKPELRIPVGFRGWSPSGAVRYWGLTQDEYAAKADLWPLNPDGELIAIAMIESPTAIENIREILATPGLGAILVGQGDLSMSIGVGTPGANQLHPEVEALVDKVAKACVDMKKLCGSYQGDVNKRLSQGFRLFTATRPK
ncbi:MAG: HpcH/HpaI aldolase/citrate lyase family protein [Vicinamibacterales bacterium]